MFVFWPSALVTVSKVVPVVIAWALKDVPLLFITAVAIVGLLD